MIGFWVLAVITNALAVLGFWDLIGGGMKAGLGTFLFGLIVLPFIAMQLIAGFVYNTPSTILLASVILPIALATNAIVKMVQ